VGFDPQTVGALSASLSVRTADGGSTVIALQGLMHSGSTSVVLDSDPGEFIGGGQDWEYNPGKGTVIFGDGAPREAAVAANTIIAVFEVPPGQLLTVGETYSDVDAARRQSELRLRRLRGRRRLRHTALSFQCSSPRLTARGRDGAAKRPPAASRVATQCATVCSGWA